MSPSRRSRRDISFRLRVRVFFYRLRYRLGTPLQLRASLHRLSHHHDRPWLALLQLFNPFPTWRFQVPEPIPAKEMLGNVPLMLSRRRDLVSLTAIPVWRARDTPLRSLYRLYEAMASGEYGPMGRETEYFWYQRKWRLHEIEDARDPDPVRYAILASLLEELVTAFNWRLSLGMRRDRNHLHPETDADPYPPYDPVVGPASTKHVPPIGRESLAELPPEYVTSDSKLVLEAGGVSEVFAKRNIVTNLGWLYTI